MLHAFRSCEVISSVQWIQDSCDSADFEKIWAPKVLGTHPALPVMAWDAARALQLLLSLRVVGSLSTWHFV